MARPEHGNHFTKRPDIVCARRPLAGRALAGVAAKVVGEFCLTSAAPERRPSKAVLDKVQSALDRQRSSGVFSGGCLVAEAAGAPAKPGAPSVDTAGVERP